MLFIIDNLTGLGIGEDDVQGQKEAFCSDKQADDFARHDRKGALVHARGEIRTQTWTDAEGQEPTSVVSTDDVKRPEV